MTPSFAMAGRFAVGDAQAAKMEAVIRAIAMLRGSARAVGVQMQFRKTAHTQIAHGGDVVLVSVAEEQVF